VVDRLDGHGDGRQLVVSGERGKTRHALDHG
jgi:hypothetical protein